MPEWQALFNRWRAGDQNACRTACYRLWQRLYGVESYFVNSLGSSADPEAVISDGYWASMIELDQMISGGRCRRTILQFLVAGPLIDALLTTRDLVPAGSLEWTSEDQFIQCVRELWTAKCWAILRYRREGQP